MAERKQVNSSTDKADKSTSEHFLQQVVDFSQASINKNKSNNILSELVKDIRNGKMDRATARLEAFEKLENVVCYSCTKFPINKARLCSTWQSEARTT